MEINCFESGEHFGNHLGPFPSILKQFEEIEKKVVVSIFHGFGGHEAFSRNGFVSHRKFNRSQGFVVSVGRSS